MIKLGKIKDLIDVRNLPKPVEEKVVEVLKILDDVYGEERDIDKDLGGYVLVIEENTDVEKLTQHFIDIAYDEPEWVDEILDENKEAWNQGMFIISDDFSVVVVARVEVLDLRSR